MNNKSYRGLLIAAIGIAALAGGAAVTLRSVNRVGDRGDKGILVNTGQWIDPDGRVTIFSARPVDEIVSPDGKTVYLKENEGLTIVDAATGAIKQRLKISGIASLTGLALAADASKLYYSDSGDNILEVDIAATPAKVGRTFKMPAVKAGGSAYPCGLLVDGSTLYAVLNRSNQVAIVDLTSGTVTKTFDVEPAPFGLAFDKSNGRLWVSSWATSPKPGEEKQTSSGTEVAVDKRGIGTGGVVTSIDLTSGKVEAPIRVGGQPCELALCGSNLFVANSNTDEVMVVDTATRKATQVYKASLGAAPQGLTVMQNGNLAIACGGSNEIVVLDATTNKPIETYKSAWYPTAVRSFDNNLFVASAKGLGERGNDLREGDFDDLGETEKFPTKIGPVEAKNLGVYQFTGVLSVIPPSTKSGEPVKVSPSLAARKDVKPVPVPERPGEPSVFKHVVYILKENRTYDQVLGDIGKGDSDPSLCIYGEKITPNHHAIAREFALLDNYYCNGVLSADGHSWSTEGNATTYFERSFGGWTRSYPYGDDPLAISSTGHIWDAVLDKGLTFRNYGEYDYTEPTKKERYLAILKDFQSGEHKIKFDHKIGLARLRKVSDPDCPGWNTEIPDVLRASFFLRDLKVAEKSGKFPSLSFVYLPQDHTSGGAAGAPSPNSHLADNDLALGQVVSAVANSHYWKDTVIFVIEDDPQAGFDHVDGHRSLCLVASAYTKRGAVVSDFYNQAGVLKTISHILGVKPSSRFELTANLMTNCFQAKPNLQPYKLRPNQTPIDVLNPSKSAFKPLDLDKPDQVDENEFNRQLWTLAAKPAPYPADLAGAHGRGLKAKGLRIDGDRLEQDDNDD